MEINENFLIALAYTSATEKDLDILAFRQKVENNLKELSAKKHQQPVPKVNIHKRSVPGI